MTSPPTGPRAAAALRRALALASAALLAATMSAGAAALTAGPAAATPPSGGPVVLDGMDPVCHSEAGEPTGGYISAVLATLYAQAPTDGDGSIAVLGTAEDEGVCGNSIGAMMAGYLSGISPAPAVHYYPEGADVDGFFTDMAPGTRPTLIWIPDNWDGLPDDTLTAHASDISSFVNSGGGLFSNHNGYGWLTAILPGAVFNDNGCNGGPSVTSAGLAAFPSLTDELVESCWHGYFTGDTGTLQPMVAWPYPGPTDEPVAVAIGGASVTLPSNFTLSAPAGPYRTGTPVTVSALVKDGHGVVVPGADVTFTVTAGPDSGLTSTVTSDGTGTATWTFTGTQGGTDTVTGSVVVDSETLTSAVDVAYQPLAAAPSLGGVAPGDQSLSLTVTPGTSDPTAEPVDISVTLSPGGASQTVALSGGPVTFAGLTNGTPYTVTAVTRNAVGDSPAATVTAVPRTVAGSPSLFSLTTSAGRLRVGVHHPADDGGSPITGYTVSLSPGGATREVSGAGDARVTFDGLTNGVTYTVSAVAHNAAGSSAPSAVLRGTPLGVPAAPGVTTETSATAVRVILTPPADTGGSAVTSYRVTVSAPRLPVRVATLPASVRAVTLYGLRPGTRYTVAATASSRVGRSAARTVAVTTDQPPAGGVPIGAVAGHPIAPGTTVHLGGGGVFAYDSAVLRPDAQRALLRITPQDAGHGRVTCTGHTGSAGGARHEHALGLARAASVCRFLVEHGLASSTRTLSRGYTQPIVTSGDADARARNRRVEITFGG